jgi:hypothetical protein
MPERTLTDRELNRALLARQLLLERVEVPLPRAIERVGGLQTQYAPSAYIGLWSRLSGFERDDLTRALERRTVIQGTLMRATIHMVSARDYWPLAAGVRLARRDWWLRTNRGRADSREMAEAAERVRLFLAGGPRPRSEIASHLGADSATWNGVGLWVDLVRAPPSGTWERRRADLYAVAEDWLGPSDATPEQGLAQLVRRYLGGFGPAPAADVASWAGVPVTMLTPAIESLGLRRFRDERGGELLDLPRAPLPDGETSAPVRFLPVWDATLLVHARRTQILPERYRPRVFNTKTPQSVSTFLVDGRVAGTWRQERSRVALEPFERLTREARRELAEEAERLGRFLA